MAEATFRSTALVVLCSCGHEMQWIWGSVQCQNEECPEYGESKVVELPKIQVTLK